MGYVGLEKTERPRLRLRVRLAAALRLCGRADTVADIGCDHGRLSVALLQSGTASRVIAVDISAASVEKTRRLAALIGLRIDVRQGDGLAPLYVGEAECIVLCGIGGTLMARLLCAAQPPLKGADRIVLQPVRGVADIRRYLRQNGYRIEQDVIVLDAGRYYQVFCARLGEEDAIPHGWPPDCYDMGPKSIGDPLFGALAAHMLNGHEKRLIKARGTHGERLLQKKAEDMRAVLRCGEESGVCK